MKGRTDTADTRLMDDRSAYLSARTGDVLRARLGVTHQALEMLTCSRRNGRPDHSPLPPAGCGAARSRRWRRRVAGPDCCQRCRRRSCARTSPTWRTERGATGRPAFEQTAERHAGAEPVPRRAPRGGEKENQKTLPRTRLLQLKKHRGRAAFRGEEERGADLELFTVSGDITISTGEDGAATGEVVPRSLLGLPTPPEPPM